MKLLYITYISPNDNKGGTGVNSNMHRKVINEIWDNNIINIYLCNKTDNNNSNDIYFGAASTLDKTISTIIGYPPFLSNRSVNKILKIIKKENISHVYIENSVSGVLVKKIKHVFPNVKVASFFHDIEKIRMKNMAIETFFRKISLPVFIRNEELTVEYGDASIVLNQRDALLYKSTYNKETELYLPICVPFPNTINSALIHRQDEPLSMLFVGADYAANVSGLHWLINTVLPHVKTQYELLIVGYNMEKYKSMFESVNHTVRVVGTVDDLEPYYENADVVVGPIFEGGGMKVKTAEAFAHGKYYIGCSESLEGYWENVDASLKDKKIFCANSAEQFADNIDNLTEQEFRKNNIDIFNWAIKNYSYDGCREKYKEIFATLQ